MKLLLTLAVLILLPLSVKVSAETAFVQSGGVVFPKGQPSVFKTFTGIDQTLTSSERFGLAIRGGKDLSDQTTGIATGVNGVLLGTFYLKDFGVSLGFGGDYSAPSGESIIESVGKFEFRYQPIDGAAFLLGIDHKVIEGDDKSSAYAGLLYFGL